MALTLLMKTASQGEVGWLVPASRLVLCGRDRSRFQPLADKLGSAPHSCSGSRPRSPNPGVGRAAACWRLLPAPSSCRSSVAFLGLQKQHPGLCLHGRVDFFPGCASVPKCPLLVMTPVIG